MIECNIAFALLTPFLFHHSMFQWYMLHRPMPEQKLSGPVSLPPAGELEVCPPAVVPRGVGGDVQLNNWWGCIMPGSVQPNILARSYHYNCMGHL